MEFGSGTLTNPSNRPRAGEPLVYMVKKGEGRKPKAPVTSEISLGRSTEQDICLDDQSVSRLHALFRHDPATGAWLLVDMESKNGTWVDRDRLDRTPHTVHDGCHLQFGHVRVQFFLPGTFVNFVKTLTAD